MKHLRPPAMIVVVVLLAAAAGTWLARSGRAAPGDGAAPPAAPLAPLSAAEIERAAALLKADPRFPAGGFTPELDLKEPPKEEVLRWQPGMAFRREAGVVVLDRSGNHVFAAVVDLNAGRVTSWTPLPGV